MKKKNFAIILLILAFNAFMTISIDTAKAATLDAYEPDNDHKEACVLRNDEP